MQTEGARALSVRGQLRKWTGLSDLGELGEEMGFGRDSCGNMLRTELTDIYVQLRKPQCR